MADNLLYFPYINLPKSSWTIRSLIYYDTVNSIVPDEYFYNPDLYEPYMRELVRENLVIPLNPTESLDHPFSLVEPFIQYVSRPGFMLGEKRRRFRQLNDTVGINRNKFPHANINGQKFDSDLLYQLTQLGVARRSDGNWYEVERMTAGHLMSYLSNILAKKLDLLPATDKEFYISGKIYQREISIAQEQRRRNKVLEGVIPFPAEMNLSKLAILKDKYKEEISLFRSTIEQIALDPKYDNERLLEEKINEMNTQKKQLYARMNENKVGQVLFGSVMGLVGGVIGYAATNDLRGAISGLPSFANAIYSALNIEDPKKIHDTSGMKYLAIVETKAFNKYKGASVSR